MRRVKLFCTMTTASVLFFFAGTVTAQTECLPGESVTALSIAASAQSSCCARSGRSQSKCLSRAIQSIRRTQPIISESVASAAVTTLTSLRQSSCSLEQISDSNCTAASSTTTAEATAAVAALSCDKSLRSKRQSTLKRKKRLLKKARNFLSAQFVNTVTGEINALQRSEECGRGGRKSSSGGARCSRVEDPRDGPSVGNVYKLGDHDGKPVFITHNGARSGQALTPNGQVIENLRYTGLANPDPRGLRHHYRLSSSCGSLPRGYLIKLGSTCYEINSPCSRID